MLLQERQDILRCQVILEQVIINAEFHGLMYVRKIIMTAQDKDVPRQAPVTHLMDQADAVEHWHTDIRDDQHRSFLLDEPQSLLSVLGISRNGETMRFPVNHLFQVRAD